MDNLKQKWMIYRPVVKIVSDYIYISNSVEDKQKERVTLKVPDKK